MAVPRCLISEPGLTPGGNWSRGRTWGELLLPGEAVGGLEVVVCSFGSAAGAVEDQALCKLSVLLLAGESAGYPRQKWALEPARCVSSNFGFKLGYFSSYDVPCACTYSQG